VFQFVFRLSLADLMESSFARLSTKTYNFEKPLKVAYTSTYSLYLEK